MEYSDEALGKIQKLIGILTLANNLREEGIAGEDDMLLLFELISEYSEEPNELVMDLVMFTLGLMGENVSERLVFFGLKANGGS